jgi:UDP-N-acetylglucosamine enolpyruvyl transferase
VRQSFVIEGAHRLSGRVRAAGNKNGALPILAACMLTGEPVELHNIPRILDVDAMLALIRWEPSGLDRSQRVRIDAGGDDHRARRQALQPNSRFHPARRAAAGPLRPRDRAAAGR